MQNLGISALRKKLEAKKKRVYLRYDYYTMKNHVAEIAGLMPPEFRSISYALGWCGKAVDSIADRLAFDGFDNDDFRISEIFRLCNGDILPDNAFLSALISSCAFIYIAERNDYPSMQVIDGGNATGVIDPDTFMMSEGYAVLERDQNGAPTTEAYFLPYKTMYFKNGANVPDMEYTHDAPYALLAPVIYRPDARRPFGHSRISRCCMDIMQAASRTLKRTEVAAEFYSIPQKYALGLSQDSEFNNQKAFYSNFLAFEKDEDGGHPTLGQFQSQSMAPFVEQMRMLASVFAGETSLTLDDLGFASENPSSQEAIRASHENLRLTARKAQKTFGTGLLNAGYLAACIRDHHTYDRYAFAETIPAWLPVFEPDAAGLGAIGDAIYKINQVSDGFFGDKNIKKITGLERDA